MAARKGHDYITRLKNNPPETWIGNEKVVDPTTHPLIAPAVQSTARLYDIQWEENKRDHMLCYDSYSKGWFGTQFLIPRSQEDLKKRRLMHKEWADATFGMMGRSSDFMTAMLTAWLVSADFFDDYAENVKNYFNYVKENDLYLTHVLINPQVDRSQPPSKQPDEFTYLGVVKETDKGIIVRGAKMLATAGPYTDEVLVWPFTNQKINDEDLKYAISFAIPMSTPGLRVIAREPYTRESKFDHPLASQFDELDGVLVFDDVLVPWDRVFIYKDVAKVNTIREITHAFTSHQTSVRLLSKMQFVAGVVMKATELVKTNQFLHVQDLIGEITTYIELCRAAIISSEATAEPNEQGIYIPNFKPLSAVRNSGNRWYPRIREIMQHILAGGLMYQPASVDVFDSPIKEDIEKYYRGAEVSAKEKIQIFKIASDLAVSDFGSRHELYERYYAGDPLFLRIGTQYQNYDKEECLALVRKLIDQHELAHQI
jgi:4-hydroxyphenylacetate 3-monooxygenase oxygenase component